MPKEKILYTATTEIHLRSFHIPYLKWFKDQGYEVHVAYNGSNDLPYADKVWNISFGRSPFDKRNKQAYKDLKEIIKENNYSIIHAHTPMGGVVTRLAARSSRKKGTKVLYTAHGFHFYKGGPLKNWLFFFPVEWFLSFYSDGIITINKEDYNHLFTKKFKSSGKFQINGIGLNPERLKADFDGTPAELRKSLGYKEEEFLILYIAEFIDRKNHKFVIDAIPHILKIAPNAKFIFAGGGELRDTMISYAKEKGITENVDFLGFRKDIGNFIAIADAGISASKQEGLGLGVAEMMYNGLPVVISEDRGHKEMVNNEENGFMFAQNNTEQFVNYICRIYNDPVLRESIGEKGKQSIQKFMIDNSLKQMEEIYNKYV